MRREEGLRVDAMMGEAEGEDEKTLMIQSLRAMVCGCGCGCLCACACNIYL